MKGDSEGAQRGVVYEAGSGREARGVYEGEKETGRGRVEEQAERGPGARARVEEGTRRGMGGAAVDVIIGVGTGAAVSLQGIPS